MPLPIPKFIRTAFAQLGQRNVIPETTNNITGAAGYNQGFGEINMLPEGAGGIPPDGKDMNGILYELSAAIQFSQAGRYFPFNQDFANSIGGYDKGAIVASQSDLSVAYRSTIDANSVAPPSAGWEISGSVQAATETTAGVAKIATQAVANALTNDTDFITSKKLPGATKAVLSASGSAPVYACRAWVNFDGRIGGSIIRGSGNVSSITDLATGRYRVNFGQAVSVYSPQITSGFGPSGPGFQSALRSSNIIEETTTSLEFNTTNSNTSGNDGVFYQSVAIFG